MDEKKIQQISKEIENEKWDYWKTKKLTDYLHEHRYELDKQDLYELVNALIKEDIFGFLYAISNALPDLASDDVNFIEMLEAVIEKIKTDMAQGPFIDSLISLGKSNPELALKLADKLLVTKNPEYSSFLIGGAFQGHPEESKSMIMTLISSKNPRHQVTAVRALRVIYKETKMDEKDKVFAFIQEAAKSDSIEVKLEAFEAFLDFYEHDEARSKKSIEELARIFTECKFSLAHRIWIKSPFDAETSLHFLETCSEVQNINVKRHVLFALVHFVEKYPEKVLEIISKYVIRDGFDFGDMAYVLEELGKVKSEKAIKIILKWLTTKKDPRLTFHIPIILKELLSKTDKKLILEPIISLIESDSNFLDKGLDILLEVISETYDKGQDDEFIPKCYDYLCGLAKQRGINIISITQGESNKILQCADLIHVIKYYSKPLDYDTIFRNVNEFVNIRDLFGFSWFEENKKVGNKTHPLLKMLEQKLPEKQKFKELADSINEAQSDRAKFNNVFRLKNLMSTALFLNKLDTNIKLLKDSGFGLTRYANNLKNEQQFDPTLSEIDFICPFLGKYKVELEPKINGKRLDAKIEIDAQTLYVEIISPNTFKPLEKLSGARTIPNRIKGKIYDEFKEQLNNIGPTGQPVIVAVDLGRSEVDYEFVEDYLFGTLKFTYYIDTKTHETVGTNVHRDEKESMHSLESEMDLISAVICYKTRLYDDLSYRTEGKIFENPHAKVPLSRSVRKTIEDIIFSRFIE